MSFLERAKQAAAQAATQAASAMDKAGQATADVMDRAGAKATDPATVAAAKRTLGRAKLGVATAIDRIDPGVLADIVIKATALQERANGALKAKGSPYRISEIGIGAAIPPSVTFTIGRVGGEDDGAIDSTRLVAAGHVAEGTVLALDGSEIDEAVLEATEPA